MRVVPGVVVITKFCRPGSERYKTYIEYIDRENAKKENKQWNLYQDYMDNPEKSTGLFTRNSDSLTKQEKKEIKELFKRAQEKDSLMWQTVISFDNKWLSENNLYHPQDHSLDEKRMKEITRNAVEKMLRNENLENAVWSAAIHYNTDNIHVHIATVETDPQRRMKEFVVYTKSKDGRGKEPLLDKTGNPIICKEYVGRFKPSSIAICKGAVVNEILHSKEINYQINDIIRNRIAAGKNSRMLHLDPEMRDCFLNLYRHMPNCDRKMWNYNNPIMAERKQMIDELSYLFIKKYNIEDFNNFKQLIVAQGEAYRRAYGQSNKKYEIGKINDLYTRLGNVILKEVKEYDKMNRDIRSLNIAYRSDRKSKATYRDRGRLFFAMRSMNQGLKNTYEKYLNEKIHEALLQGRSIEEIDLPGRE